MKTGNQTLCDYCNEEILPYEGTTIHIKNREGHGLEFHYHNRNEDDCLAKKLVELRDRFPTFKKFI